MIEFSNTLVAISAMWGKRWSADKASFAKSSFIYRDYFFSFTQVSPCFFFNVIIFLLIPMSRLNRLLAFLSSLTAFRFFDCSFITYKPNSPFQVGTLLFLFTIFRGSLFCDGLFIRVPLLLFMSIPWFLFILSFLLEPLPVSVPK